MKMAKQILYEFTKHGVPCGFTKLNTDIEYYNTRCF
jgi:hypothetical protein